MRKYHNDFNEDYERGYEKGKRDALLETEDNKSELIRAFKKLGLEYNDANDTYDYDDDMAFGFTEDGKFDYIYFPRTLRDDSPQSDIQYYRKEVLNYTNTCKKGLAVLDKVLKAVEKYAN